MVESFEYSLKFFDLEYDKYKESGLLPATYEVIYGHAWNMNKNEKFKTFEIIHE